MEESCHITRFLQDLSISVIVDELKKLIENPLNLINLILVLLHKGVLGHEFLLLFLVPFFELQLYFLLFII